MGAENSKQRGLDAAVNNRRYECWYRVRSSSKVEIFVGHRMAVSIEEISLLPEWIASALFSAIQGQAQSDEFETGMDRACIGESPSGEANGENRAC